MKIYILYLLLIISCFSCQKKRIKFELFSSGKKVLEILPTDISFYDTSQIRNGINIHEIRLKKSFYKNDTMKLIYPFTLKCKINNELYFNSDFLHAVLDQPGYKVSFTFKTICINGWSHVDLSYDKNGNLNLLEVEDTLKLFTKNECNSIEFFHMRDVFNSDREGWEKIKRFKNYTDTARLAHEFLMDPYYINALKESGVKIK